MTILLNEINQDFDWRLSELSTIKTLPFRYSISTEHKEFLFKYSVPMIYAVWEGFVKNSFSNYLTEIKKLNLSKTQLHKNYIAHSVDSKCQLNDGRKHLTSKIKFIDEITEVLQDPVSLSVSVPTKSNVNYKVLKQITTTFNLQEIDSTHKTMLDKLLFFRNRISHGENSIVVSSSDIISFIQLVEDLMVELILIIEDAINNKKYMN